MEIEIIVEPYNTESMSNYHILWREKKKFNLFNFWKELVKVWDGAYLNYDQPILFNSFESAVEYAKELKENPEMIKEHYDKQDKIYEDAKQRRNDYRSSRNKSINI